VYEYLRCDDFTQRFKQRTEQHTMHQSEVDKKIVWGSLNRIIYHR